MGQFETLASGLLAPIELAKARAEKTRLEGLTPTERGAFYSLVRRAIGYSPVMAMEKPADEPQFTFLRRVAKRSAIDKVIINARVQQTRLIAQPSRDDEEQGLRVVHDRDEDKDFDSNTEEIQARIKKVEDVLFNPYEEVHPTFKDAILKMVRDELTIDRKAMVVTPGRHGRPVRWHLIDSATIKPRMEILHPWMLKHQIFNQNTAAEYLSGMYEIDLTKAAWVQEIDGQVVAAWGKNELSVDVTNPINEIDHYGYGRSLLEDSLETTNLFMKAWGFNNQIFDIKYPEAVLVVYGDSDQDGLQKFKRGVQGQVGQGASMRLPVIEGGDSKESGFKVETQKLRDTPREMMFVELIRMVVALKCGAYRMHPSTINFGTDSSGNALFDHRNEAEGQMLAQEEGFHSILMNLAEWFTRSIVKKIDPDLKCVWEGLSQEDEKAEYEVIDRKVRTHVTVDEIRKSKGQDPLPEGRGEVILDPTYLQFINMKAQQEAQQQMQEQQMQGQGDFGNEEDDDAGFWDQMGQSEEEGQGQEQEQQGPPQGQTMAPPQGEDVEKSMSQRVKRFLTIEID